MAAGKIVQSIYLLKYELLKLRVKNAIFWQSALIWDQPIYLKYQLLPTWSTQRPKIDP